MRRVDRPHQAMLKGRFSQIIILDWKGTGRVPSLYQKVRWSFEGVLLENIRVEWIVKDVKGRDWGLDDINAERNDGKCEN